MASQIPPLHEIDPSPSSQSSTNETTPISPRANPIGRDLPRVANFTLPSIPSVTTTPPPTANDPWANVEVRKYGNYFAPRLEVSSRSAIRLTRGTSPSEILSTSSSDVGHSLYSGSSSEYLKPPLSQVDEENPPYKARRRSSVNLNMVKKLRRANTLPDEKEVVRKLQKRHRNQKKRHKYGQRTMKMHEHHNRSYWGLSGCQVVPTAPRGQKDLCESIDSHHTKSKLLGIDLSGSLSPTSGTSGAPSIIARRWSSVEVGVHQIISELTACSRPPMLNELAGPAPKGHLGVQRSDSRFRSSTYAPGATDNDIVRIVRERLTLRKIPSSLRPKTPDSITLRRASEYSSQSEALNTPDAAIKSAEPSVSSSPLARLQDIMRSDKQQPSAAYLITSKDIESITSLIEEDIRCRYEARPSAKVVTSPASVDSELSTITSKSVSTPQSHLDEAQNRPGQGQDSRVQVVSGQENHIDIPRKPSQQSLYEVIWQGPESPLSISSATEDDETELKQSSYCECLPDTPQDMAQPHECKAPSTDLGEHVGGRSDPKKARVSINEWPLKRQQNELALAVASSGPESTDNDVNADSALEHRTQMEKEAASMPATMQSKRQIKKKVQHNPSPALSDSNLKQLRSQGLKLGDLTSFPPLLTARPTEESGIPLPEIVTTPPLDTSTTQPLYELGLDANSGPLSSSSKTVTPHISFADLRQEVEEAPYQVRPRGAGIEFNPAFDMRRKSVVKADSLNIQISPDALDPSQSTHARKKSIVKDHPSAVPIVGDRGRMGYAIGSYGHERRRSSAVLGIKAKRVRTIDNAHKGERDVPSSKWRPPSVCPPRKPSSPMGLESSREVRPRSPSPSPAGTSRKGRSGHFDRAALIKVRSLPQPRVNAVGIYAELTGSQQPNTYKDAWLREGARYQPHDCDDCARDSRNPPSVDWIG